MILKKALEENKAKELQLQEREKAIVIALENAEELRKAITADAPVSKTPHKKRKTGTQKKSWKIAKEKVAGIDLLCIVHSTDYQLVHLLENGHLTRDGKTRSKAFHYVSKNEEQMRQKYQTMLERTIRTVK